MNEVERNIQHINTLCVNHGVEKLYLFGSVANKNFTPHSDIDFVVQFKQLDLLVYSDNYFDLKFSLEDLLQRPVDLLEAQALKNPYFIESFNETKKLIYG